MSTNVESIYQSALLADAAYVTLTAEGFVRDNTIREDAFLGSLNDDAQSFSERGFSREEFDAFRLRYRVLQHQPDSLNGFSATLFEDTTTGQLHLAFRGTNDLADVFMDLGLAVDEAYRYEGLLQNGSVTDFLKTAGILDEWGSVRPEFAGRVHVVGHSLGGYLATWSAFRHPEMVSSVDTFNGAGLVYGTPLAMFLNTLWGDDLPQPGFDRSRITHYFAEPGPELTAAGAIAFRPGRRVPLFIENQSGEPGNILDNHSMAHLVDALGAYRLLARLDPMLELGEITGILEAASNRGEGSLAALCLAIGEALGGAYVGIADPLSLYAAITAQLEAGAWPGLRIEPIAGRDLATLAAEDSATGSAARFALQELHPFLLIADGTAAAGVAPDAMPEAWIAHRALLLDALLARNTNDALTSGRTGAEAQWYADVASNTDFTSADATLPFPLDGAEQHRFGGDAPDTLAGGRLGDGLFGGAGADSLAGNEGDDALGGGAGDDTLSGGSGDDRLEGESGADLLEGGAGWDLLLGGEGADTYVFGSAHGNDIVLDADSGGDRVLIAGRDVATLDLRAVEAGANLYRDDAHPGIQAQRQIDGLLLTSAEGMVLLSGWRQNGDFGIGLRDAGAREPGEAPGVTDGREIRGDLAALDTDPASPGLQSGTDELGNLLTDPATPELRDDQLFGSAGGDRLLGGGGADRLLARGGNDEVHGDAGSDQLLGEAGDDWLTGGEGTDVLAGGAGADRLFAATGNPSAGETAASDRDWLAGGEGDDTLTGSAGSEGFSGGPGADLVFAGAGDDQVLSDADIVVMSFDWGWVDDTAEGTRRFTPAEGSIDPPGAGADTVHGGDGNDWLSLGRGADLGFGDAGNDTLGGHAGADTLSGGEGDDLLEGDARLAFLPAAEHGNDLLEGGAGKDSLTGAGGADLLLGGEGDDRLWGDADELPAGLHGADTLRGAAGADWLEGQGGGDELAGGDGNDTIGGGAGHDTVRGGAGDDRLWGDSTTLAPAGDGNDRVLGEAGHDEIVGGGGNDTLLGGDGDDRLWGVDGVDLLQGGAGADALWGGAGEDLLRGGAGDDSVVGGEDADRLEGEAGNDILQAEGGADALLGGSGNDTLLGDAGNDTLDGGEGADELQGADGDDVLAGGLDADRLFGDAGADRLLGDAGADELVGGDGDDTLEGGADADTLWGGAGADVFVIGADGGMDLIADAEPGDRLLFPGAEAPEVLALQHRWGDSQLSLHYAGTEVRMGVSAFRSLRDFATASGPVDSASLVRPTEGVDRVLLAASDDRLATRGGADLVMGGDGADTLSGEAGDDELHGEAGADWLEGGNDADFLLGGDGADRLDGGSGNDNLAGGTGDDTLDGGHDNDTLDGGVGNDTYLFGPGAGRDQLFLGASGEQDRVLIAAGVPPESLRVRSDGTDDLYLELASGERLRVASFFGSAAASTLQVHFTDSPGTVWDAAMLRSRVQPAPTAGNDTIEGFAGADVLAGAGGDDSLNGGLGNDTLSGDAGNDLLQGGEGQDQLAGGAGSDTLRGGAGTDTYIYRPGDGEDLIIERDVPASPDTDVLRFGAGILPSQLSTRVQLRDPTGPIGLSDFVEQNLEFVHEIAGQGRVRVLPPDDMNWQDSRVEEIRFEDSPATVIRWGDTIAAMQLADAGNDLLLGTSVADTVDAQAGDDLLWGADGNDWLRGGEGRDSLLGGNGADTLDGGAGDDFLRGGNDPNPNNGLVDRYVWGRGYGSDTVWARPDNVFWTSGGMPFPADILDLSGLQWSEIRAARIGADLELSIPGTADRVTVLGYFDSGHSQVRIRDSVGGEYRLDAVERKIVESAVLAQVSAGDDTIIGSVYDDNVDASTGNDRLEGRAGNDTLSGGAGNDVLDGGVGDDLLAGGAGNDDYRFTPGAGIDRILDQDKSTGRWDRIVVDGVAPSDIRVSRSADDLVLTLPGTDGQLTVAKHFFVKGKDIGWHVDEVRFADGSAWSRTMLQDFVTRSASGHWSLQGGSGADLLESLGGNDTLAGAAGADTLRGGGGEDRLIGGPGADLLAGGSGPDVYVFARGDGADTVIDEAGSTQIDVLEFGAGIAPGEVLAYRAGQSDLLLVAGGSDRIRVPGFFDGQSAAGTGVERIRFADGSEWRREDLQQAPPAPAGSAPQGGPDRVATTEGQPLAIPVSTLLANDTDADGDPLVLRGVTAISGGSVSLDPTGSTVNFTPSPYFSGAAAFDYLLSDGTSEVPVRVTVDVSLPTGSTVRKGTEGADSLLGTRGDDRLYGLGGNDTLRADRGNDVLSGGRGNDTLEGSLGNDVYVFQTGDGADVIDNRSARSGEIDVLQLTDGITRDSLRFQRQADDLLIGIGQGGDSLTVRGWYLSEPARLDEIRVGGSVLYAAEVERLAQAIAGFAALPAAVPVIGTDPRDALEGGWALPGEGERIFRSA